MTDALLAGQVSYYRARAGEYDTGAYPEPSAAQARIAATVAGLRVRGSVLEIACGTGMWTRALARHAAALTAVDAAPETVTIARRRAPAAVRFEVGDAFAWTTSARFDVVFFAFWLSHVPAACFGDFFARVGEWLAPGGRVVFVDEPVRAAGAEPELAGDEAVRTLADGSRHRIVKRFLDPADVAVRLGAAGWRAELADRGDWLLGQAWPPG